MSRRVAIAIIVLVAILPMAKALVCNEVFFSRDCTVVITVGADTQTQRTFRAEAYDVHRQRKFCSVAFDAAAASLQAELAPPAGDNQDLRITVGGQLKTCPLF